MRSLEIGQRWPSAILKESLPVVGALGNTFEINGSVGSKMSARPTTQVVELDKDGNFMAQCEAS